MNKVLITSKKNYFAVMPLLKGQLHFPKSLCRLASYFLHTSLRSQLPSVLSCRTLGGLATNPPFLLQTDKFPFPQSHSIFLSHPFSLQQKKTRNRLLADTVTCHILDPICQPHRGLRVASTGKSKKMMSPILMQSCGGSILQDRKNKLPHNF